MIAQNSSPEPALHYYARFNDRGFSNAAYQLLYTDRRNDLLFYVLDLSSDPQVAMPKGFLEADVLPAERDLAEVVLEYACAS